LHKKYSPSPCRITKVRLSSTLMLMSQLHKDCIKLNKMSFEWPIFLPTKPEKLIVQYKLVSYRFCHKQLIQLQPQYWRLFLRNLIKIFLWNSSGRIIEWALYSMWSKIYRYFLILVCCVRIVKTNIENNEKNNTILMANHTNKIWQKKSTINISI